jgi:hypothetical protein
MSATNPPPNGLSKSIWARPDATASGRATSSLLLRRWLDRSDDRGLRPPLGFFDGNELPRLGVTTDLLRFLDHVTPSTSTAWNHMSPRFPIVSKCSLRRHRFTNFSHSPRAGMFPGKCHLFRPAICHPPASPAAICRRGAWAIYGPCLHAFSVLGQFALILSGRETGTQLVFTSSSAFWSPPA